MVIMFTGMSGIKITESLSRFCSEYKEFKTGGSIPEENRPVIIKLDAEIEGVYYDKNPKQPITKRLWINKILFLPYSVFEEYWNAAFDNVESKIKEIKAKNPNRYIFLNLHACYFHNKTQEYISLINIEKLQKVNPIKIITIIDDIFDIHERLEELGGIYHDYSDASPTELILRYMRLLDWRSKETMMSKFIARQIKKDEKLEICIDHFLFAAKHSFETLYNLIYKKSFKTVYLSHPITEVRRLEKKNKIEEVGAIKNEINKISNSLTQAFTTFLPTTIDEYRIFNAPSTTGIKNENAKVFKAVLTDRWDPDKYKIQNDFLFKISGFNEKNNLWRKIEEIKDDQLDAGTNYLLSNLANFIKDQVTTRDYSMVEQSEILVIYRPLFNGNKSSGVEQEFQYYKSLKEKNDMYHCFIYCPLKDTYKFYTEQLTNKVKYHLEQTKH